MADALFDGRAFAAVLFDLDGTLVDSRAAIDRAWAAWAVELGLSDFRFDRHGVPAAEIVADIVGPERAASALRRINELEVAETEGVVELPGAREALDVLPDGRVAIVTSSTAALAAARLAAAGLRPPTVLIAGDQGMRGKPAPDPFLAAARQLGFASTDCLVVEDSPAGAEAGRAAGCAVLALATTHLPGAFASDAVVVDLSRVRFEAGQQGVVIRA